MNDRLVLKNIFRNSGLSGEDIETIVYSFEKVSFKKGEFVLREGQVASDYYFIEKGFMRAYAVDTNGNEITTAFYAKNKLVLEVSSFFLRIPAKEYIQVMADSDCWRIKFEKFQELFHGITAFREVSRTRLVNGYFALKNRTLSLITDSAEVRYLQLLKEHAEVIEHVPLKYIATYLGITDTSLSRIRKDLAKK